jgi:hypothetical protein
MRPDFFSGHMTIVAVHQPNYLPWLGFFCKISQSDVFIFLDDAQYTKNSYINRVSVLCKGNAKWLTVPVRVPLGTPICAARPADAGWVDQHLERLSNYYRKAPARREALSELMTMYSAIEPDDNIANINMMLIRAVASRLGIAADFRAASEFHHSEKRSNERLIALVRSIDEHGTYLSGAGASAYQRPELFEAAGLGIQFSSFAHPVYAQASQTFTAGLSAIDAVFWLGWEGAGALLRRLAKVQ